MSGEASAKPARGTDRVGRSIETFLLALTLGAMVMLAAAQILLRNVWGSGLAWADETLRILVLWVTMLGAVAASREQRHVSIDALSRNLPSHLRSAVAFLIEVATAVLCAVLAWYSYIFVADSWSAGEAVLGGKVPAWAVQAILPASFALMGYRYALAGLRRVVGRGKETQQP